MKPAKRKNRAVWVNGVGCDSLVEGREELERVVRERNPGIIVDIGYWMIPNALRAGRVDVLGVPISATAPRHDWEPRVEPRHEPGRDPLIKRPCVSRLGANQTRFD